ncbi:uncharacterized protein [Aristolochia californica]|uniref:uncharacterized protein n=1 Tax=Aristolochia californica TaxID=171875 RepID=UPI0035DB7111
MASHWSILDQLIWYKRRIYFLLSSPLVLSILSVYHDNTHEGLHKTLQRIRGDFYWAGLKSHVAEYVATCLVCQRNKADHLSPAGVLQPLDLPTQCLVWDSPKKCVQCISWAEYCYNTSFHRALQETPFKILYGRDPPRLLSYKKGSTRVDAVDHALQSRDQLLANALDRLRKAQAHMQLQYDQHHRDVQYRLDDFVWLRLQPYR